MIKVLRSTERGHVDHGWLDARHTFSFGHYHDPERMGFHALRVINEDVIAPGQGFGKHFHDDMEILTYVTEGALAHQDNTGGGGMLTPGIVQRMSAGRGIIHSERNASVETPLKLLQIWIIPKSFSTPPSYEQKEFTEESKRGVLRLIASADGRDGSLTINQDADVFASVLWPGETVTMALGPGRHAWVQMVSGRVDLDRAEIAAGDGAAIDGETSLTFLAREPSEFIVFDLP